MAIFMLKAAKSFRRGSVARDRDDVLDPKQYGLPPHALSNTVSEAPVLSLDMAHAPAVRAFLADRQEDMLHRQAALARAVMLARQVC